MLTNLRNRDSVVRHEIFLLLLINASVVRCNGMSAMYLTESYH